MRDSPRHSEALARNVDTRADDKASLHALREDLLEIIRRDCDRALGHIDDIHVDLGHATLVRINWNLHAEARWVLV